MLRRKTTTYAIEFNETQEDGSTHRLRKEVSASPYIQHYHHIESLEDLLMIERGKPVKIVLWFPVRTNYEWFPFLKRKPKVIEKPNDTTSNN